MIGVVVYLSLIPHPPTIFKFSSADKLEHLIAYAGLMGWFCQIYQSGRSRIIWAIFLCIMGITLEFLQEWGGSRAFEYADMLADSLGVLLGWWISSRFCAGWLARIDQLLSR